MIGLLHTVGLFQMVDASVGTDSDNFYRSTKTKKVQIDPKKKKPLLTASASTGTGTDLGKSSMQFTAKLSRVKAN